MTEELKSGQGLSGLPADAVHVGSGWSDKTVQEGQDHRSGPNWDMQELPADTKYVYLVLITGDGGFDVKVDRSMASDPTLATGLAPSPSDGSGMFTRFEFNPSYRANYYCASPKSITDHVGFTVYTSKTG